MTSRSVSLRVSVHEAKAKLSELLEAARRGEEIVITRYGRPLARLSPWEEGVRLGTLRHLGPVDWEAFHAPLPEEELRAWEG
ncbi:type II toxin-antitoxin system Phd/YefM family antitoxin [Thermus tenuipuniceus]|uniref:type II toxin-antitoxin system Phd/YefM family antitoxin n=1 Tax=Thermus tenuipuniceus TaxID=2078690 RepID=UPI000CF92CB3|nr:type II toxin-antitoxin system prevent-host-death family antitoxin [Thermus tenuipuniceus]